MYSDQLPLIRAIIFSGGQESDKAYIDKNDCHMSILLETKRLIIKVPTRADFDNLLALQSDADVMQYVGQGVRTKDEVMAGLEKAIAHQDKYGFSLGCVFEKETSMFVGRAGLIYLGYDDTQPDIEVGYVLAKSCWKKGYATELCNALINWGFQHLSITRIVAVINSNNERSRHVLEKAKMNYVGRTYYCNAEVALYDIYNLNINFNQIELTQANLKDLPIFENLGHLYAYDISEYFFHEKGWGIADNGVYEHGINFIKYWQDENSFPFLVRYKNEIAGFAIVDKKGSHPAIDFNIAQFFVLKKFTHKGIGSYVAHQCFKKFPGVWEVMVIPGNEGAYRFWRAAIKKYSNNNFTEYTREVVHFKNNRKNIFKFDSRNE